MTATSSATHAAPAIRSTPPLPLQKKSYADKIFSAEQSTAKASFFKRVTTAFWGNLKNCIHKIIQIVLAPFKAVASFFRWFFVGSKTTASSQPKPAEKPIKKPIEPVQKPAGKPISVSSAQPAQKPASAPSTKIFSKPEEIVKEARAHFPPNQTLFLQPYQFQSEVPPRNETSAEAAPESSHIKKDPLAILSSLSPEDTKGVQEKGTFSGKTSISFSGEIEKFSCTPHIRNEEGCFTHSNFFPSPFCTFYALDCLWTALERGLILTRDTAGDFIDSVIEKAFAEANKNGNSLSRAVSPYKSLEAFPRFKVDDRFPQFEESGKALEKGEAFKGYFKDATEAFSQKKGEITGFIFKHCLTGDIRFVLFDNRGEESIGYLGFKSAKTTDTTYVPTIRVATPHRISAILGKFLDRWDNAYTLLPLTLHEQTSSETSKPEEKKE